MTCPLGHSFVTPGAIVSGGQGAAAARIAALAAAGVLVLRSPAQMGSGMQVLVKGWFLLQDISRQHAKVVVHTRSHRSV
jgi:succinyl-CoA synthetase alpha subunit